MKEDIRFFPRKNPNAPISIQMAGVSYCDGTYHIVRPCSEITVIEYVCSGEGSILINQKRIHIQEGNVYILPKGMYHEYYSSSTNPMTKIFFNLYGDLAVTLLSHFLYHAQAPYPLPYSARENGLSGTPLSQTGSEPSRKDFPPFSKDRFVYNGADAKYLFLKARNIMFGNMEDDRMNTELCGLYFQILSKLHVTLISEKTNTEGTLLKNYIETNFSRKISNEELAGHIYRSVDYCIKLFKQEYDTTPYDYQIAYKLQFARSLLRDTQLPISEIAMTIGYDDAQYFSNLFKYKCGMSPREYRKSQKTRDSG